MIIQGGKYHGGKYYDQPDVVTAGLVQYMDAKDYSGSGTTWPAQVGNSGTLINAPAYSTSNGGYFTFTPGSLQYALFPNIGDLSNWTAEAWFKTSADLSTQAIGCVLTTIYDDNVTQYHNLNYTLSSYTTGYESGHGPNFAAGYFNGTWCTNVGFTPTVGQWYQVVGTFDGTTLSTYVNGTLNTYAAGVGASIANGAPIRVARRWDGLDADSTNYFPGSISIVKIYNAALNADQVLQNYNATKARFGL